MKPKSVIFFAGCSCLSVFAICFWVMPQDILSGPRFEDAPLFFALTPPAETDLRDSWLAWVDSRDQSELCHLGEMIAEEMRDHSLLGVHLKLKEAYGWRVSGRERFVEHLEPLRARLLSLVQQVRREQREPVVLQTTLEGMAHLASVAKSGKSAGSK